MQRDNFSNHFFDRLPEVPIDTEETNAVMRSYREYPEYDKIKPSAIIAGTCKYALLAEVDMGKHVDKLRSNGNYQTDPTWHITFAKAGTGKVGPEPLSVLDQSQDINVVLHIPSVPRPAVANVNKT